MKDILWLIKNNIKVLLKRKKGTLLMVGMPILGIIVSILSYGGGTIQTLHVGVVNNDQNELSTDTIKFIKSLDHVKVSPINGSEVENKLTGDALDCVVTLDKGYSESVRNGNPDHIQIVSIKGAQVTTYIKSYLNNYIDNIVSIGKIAGQDQKEFDQLYSSFQDSTFKVTAGTLEDTSKNNDMTYQTMGYLVMFMLFAAVNLSSTITREKENRTYLRIMSTSITARSYVFANVLVNVIFMAVQILVTILFMTEVFHIDISMPLWQMFMTLMVFALITIGLSLMLVSFAKSSKEISGLQNLIITPTCLLAGCFFPISIMPDTLQKIADFLPQHWLLDTITKLQHGASFGTLYLNFMILIAFALVFFLVAIYKFSKQNDVRNFV